ncbi:unnamed protein product [Mytilus coruscus]|uniref:BACK domain-containing protein n=1 Tax=Mytilus coruscus TaxID=42192 RepID=A0A6J8BBT4_MYTCO|nr:unnamed protein product [Mytilus coruscus]
MSKECMESILQLDLANCSETDICQFLIKWAGSQCEAENNTPSGEHMRKITGPLLYLVRFPLTDKIYFANEIVHSGFLTLEEVVSVFSSHYVDNISNNNREIIIKILNDSGNEICKQKYESSTQRCYLQTDVLSEPIPLNSNECFTIMVNSEKFVAYYENKCKPECKIDDAIVTYQKSPHCNKYRTKSNCRNRI